MNLFQQIKSHILDTYIEQTNTQLPVTHTISQTIFQIEKKTTYQQLARQYDPNIILYLKPKGILDERIIIVRCHMQPENMNWILWKNFNEINEFLENFEPEITLMGKTSEYRLDKNGNDCGELIKDFVILKTEFNKGVSNFEMLVSPFIKFINDVSKNLFLRKSIHFLYFIGHCISIDKWHMLIHQQVYLYKPTSIANKFIGLFKDNVQTKVNRVVEKFITITADGILLSDDHLLLSRVQKMIPFTNQMQIKCYLTSDDDFIYEITSGKIDKLKFNFYKDYISGANFGFGLGRALKDSGYNFLMGLGFNEQLNNNFDNLGYEKDYIDTTNMRTTTNLKNNRYGSFAQIRENCNCKMYNDGCGYYEDLYNQLMKAEKQVCITGWMITPYFMLKRPANIYDTEYRLDGVLSKLAERGVKIFIIVFMQPSLFVNNDSEHVQKHMQSLHKNIKVYRHPNVAVPRLWSHHQKLVIVDQKVGFLGGLDICYGRWDTPEHRLVQDQNIEASHKLWDGQQFNNYRLKDVYEPRIFWKSNLNKDFQPRMPWHDIAVQIRGDVVIDLLKHFVQYWYFVKSQISADPRKLFHLLQKRLSHANSYYDKIQKQYILKQMKNDTEDTFAQKFNSIKENIGAFFTGEQQRISELLIQQRMGQNSGDLKIQMLRSACQQSIGLDLGKHESSIHNAYQDLIQNSESYIYIENQFFMGLENKIVERIVQRILRAKKQKKPFRIVVVMPLLPGFEGYIGDPNSTVLRIQVHWQFQAITRGKNSLHQSLFASGFSRQQIDQYIFFFGLRKGQFLNGIPISEIVYVHSKLMIVDDKKAIIGSANINDRSLLGNRDSQIAICVESPNQNSQAFSLRKRLFQQHFGFKQTDSFNFLDGNVWNRMIGQARTNTEVYRAVFGSLPDDQVQTSLQIETWIQKVADITRWGNLQQKIVGHAVVFPLQFMKGEDLTFRANQKQFYAPEHSFT